ncbi:MAG: hypothetical protein J5856_05485 [Lachnospiraceae bacterium]|nr:hypothetical protein [Lachnospiraceae bacterium]
MSSNSSDASLAIFAGLGIVVYLFLFLLVFIVSVLALIAMWKIFKKAGKPGWAAIIPVYNIWVLCEILFNNNILWFVLFILAPTSVVAMIVSCLALAKAYGKGIGFGVLTIFIPIVGYCILAFSDAQYTGEKM